MRKLEGKAIENIAIGATILGTGGGGDPYIGKLMALSAIKRHGPVKLLDPDEVPDDSLILPSAMMGAPTVLVEKIPRGDEVLNAFKVLEKRLGKRAFATISCEAGGVNSTVPLAVGANLDIPVVDADGMGRAFPEIQMVTWTVSGISATPMAITDEKGNVTLLETINNLWTERISRAITVTMGGSAMISLYPMIGEQMRNSSVLRTISTAEEIGSIIRTEKYPIDKILEITNSRELFEGKIVDVNRRLTGGFVKGECSLEGIEDYRDSKFVIHFQNENLIAIKDDNVAASVPDLITVLDIETGQPITTESLRYGYRVIVIGMPCVNKWRNSQGLEIVGPKYFGYKIDYVPIEQLAPGE